MLIPATLDGTLPGADLPMLVVFVLSSFESVLPLPVVIQRAGEMGAAARRLFELIDARPGVREPARPAPAPTGAECIGISIRNLRFRYEESGPPVFDGLSLEVAPGARLAIVGPTGAGKSTLIGILMRVWEYEAGRILLAAPGGRPVELRALAGDRARGLFSVMPQAPHLFHATLRENLQIAAPPGGGLPDSALEEALRSAELGGLLARLPEGLDTVVGETGKELSLGEVRRVALARAFLRRAPVSVLDEPTESLDDATADAVLAAAAAKLQGRTLIIVTHRERDLSIVDSVVRLAPP
jgi:ATP-binding cassette subfamily C protein CydC